MDFEIFLVTVFQISAGIAFGGFCLACAATALYYSWKMAEGLIRGRTRYVSKLKKSKLFDAYRGKPAVRMVQNAKQKMATK